MLDEVFMEGSGSSAKWQDVAAEREQHLADTIAAVMPKVPVPPAELPLNVTGIPSQLLPTDVISITESPPELLVLALSTGRLSAVSVASAFLQRAGLASRLTNCITELMPAKATERARYLDDYLAKTGRPIGPLHGLPISVKEHIGMKDMDWNAAFVSWVGRKAPDDALILKLLWNAGAVFYARTTEPQALMHLETSNNIYGRTVNPFNRNLTSGGSSGGEGALLGLRGSCMGIGTDIGGSIRSPSANNGLFGLRPTSYRLPNGTFAATMQGEEQILPVVGPLSTSLEGVRIFMKTLVDQQPWLYEATLLPFPWQQPSLSPTGSLLRVDGAGKRKLRIGVMSDDGIVRPHPPVLRGIDTLVGKLQYHPDFEIVRFLPYKHDEGWEIISSLYFPDGGSEELEAIEASGEPILPLTKFIITENPNCKYMTIEEVWKLTVRRDKYRSEYAAHWNRQVNEKGEALDVILCPVGPGCAPPHECARYWNYTSQWNLLDYPAVVFPTSLSCQPHLDPANASYKPRNSQDQYNYDLYQPERYADAPISLQLVGRRYDDEKILEALEMMLDVAGLPKVKV